jgi:hypothetical protein
MQVRSLSIKTTEILQLDLAIREEMDNVLDELDALLFAVNFDPVTETQLKAITLRVNTLAKIGQLLPEKNLFAPGLETLAESIEQLKSHPDETGIQEALDRLNRIRDLLKHTPKGNPPASIQKVLQDGSIQERQVRAHTSSKTTHTETMLSPATSHKHSMDKVCGSLEEEFHLTTTALRDVLNPTKISQIDKLLSHASQIFQDLMTTTKGQVPKPRPVLNRIPCLLVSVKGHSYALPQKSVLSVLSPDEYRSHVEAWNCPGGRIIKANGHPATEMSLAEALGLSPEKKADDLPHVLVETTRGVLLVAAETSGDFVPLVPDLGSPFLTHYGPYLGAAIHPATTATDTNPVIMILNPEAMAKVSPITQHPSLPVPTPVPHSSSARVTEPFIKSLVAISPGNKFISIPMAQVSHVELIPTSAVSNHNGQTFVRIGQKYVRAIDPDKLISPKSKEFTWDVEDIQAMIVGQGPDAIAILTREIVGPKQESYLTNFGYDQKPGIRGAALCDDLVVCALDPWAVFKPLSHFSDATLKRAKIT